MQGNTRDDRKRPQQNGLRINNRIRIPEIRLINADGEQLGVVQTRDALQMAQDQGLDLVEISPRAVPPVCKIMDYGKYKYEQSKKKPKNTGGLELKEIKFRPKTDTHDLDFKTKHIREFLEAGHKVRLTVTFRGREMAHPRIGNELLDRLAESLAELASVETRPVLEGRNMFLILAPRPSR